MSRISDEELKTIVKYGSSSGISSRNAEELLELRAQVKALGEENATLRDLLESTKVSFQSLFLTAHGARLAMPEQKIVSMELSDFRVLRELGKAIDQCNNVAKKIEQALKGDLS